MTTVQQIVNQMNQIAPPCFRCEGDPIGLQTGNPRTEVTGILLALDANNDVVDEAIATGKNMIVCHHPTIFNPLQNLSETTDIQKLITKAIRHNIAIFAAHTNLDIAPGGVNDVLADYCDMTAKRSPLTIETSIPLFLITVYLPVEADEKIKKAAWKTGAGQLGNYSRCSFVSVGEGTFYSNENTNPHIGNQGQQSTVTELRREFIVEEANLHNVLQAITVAHPYETPLITTTPLQPQTLLGLGRIGKINQEKTVLEIAQELRLKTQSPMIQYFGNPNQVIKKIAVWSGTGFKPHLIRRHQPDLVVTGELSYHVLDSLSDANCAVILLGHAHSESLILPTLQKQLQQTFPELPITCSEIPERALINLP